MWYKDYLALSLERWLSFQCYTWYWFLERKTASTQVSVGFANNILIWNSWKIVFTTRKRKLSPFIVLAQVSFKYVSFQHIWEQFPFFQTVKFRNECVWGGGKGWQLVSQSTSGHLSISENCREKCEWGLWAVALLGLTFQFQTLIELASHKIIN